MMMKISKCKKELARIISEHGGWRNGEFAAQDGDDCAVWFYDSAPVRSSGAWWVTSGSGLGHCGIEDVAKLPNWHQTVLSRAEFDQIVAETAPDADGWIKCSNDELPAPYGTMIDVKYSDGDELHGAKCGVFTYNLVSIRGEFASAESFEKGDDFVHIIAYRLHKPEHTEIEYKDGVKPIDPAKEDGPSKPTLDKLLQDWRNADDYAKRKQAEADEAAAMREERWNAVQARAGEVGVTVCVRDSRDDELKLAITDWRDLQIGDEIIIDYVDDYTDWKKNLEGKTSTIVADGVRFPICATNESCPNGESWFLGAPIKIKWRFIRRP